MTCQMLLQVLEEASIAEVVDVSTEKHQLWVDVVGHTVVGGHGVANNGWHHEGGSTVVYTLPTAFYQGTKSGQRTKNKVRLKKKTFRKAIKHFFLASNCLRTKKTCIFTWI